MRSKLIICLFTFLCFISLSTSAQKSSQKNKKSNNKEVIIKDKLKVVLPKNAEQLTYGYFLDSLSKFYGSTTNVLYSNSYVYYHIDGVFVSISMGSYEKKRTWDMVLQSMDGLRSPNQPREFQEVSANGKRVIIKKFNSGSLFVVSLAEDGITNVHAEIFYRKSNIENAYKEANRIAETFEFLPVKQNVKQLIKIKDFITFEIPEDAKQLNYDEYVKRKKESNFRVGLDPNFDRMAYYEYKDLIFYVSASRRDKARSFDETIKIATFGDPDYSIHSFGGRKVVVSYFDSLNSRNISGLDPKGLTSFFIVMYFKPELELDAVKEMERLVRSIKFQ